MSRINFFGGPSSSKSTTAAWLFSELKVRHISVELVNEFVKSWVYEKRKIDEMCQFYIGAKQLYYEYRFLVQGVKNIVTDSPVLLASIYSDIYWPCLNLGEHLEAISNKYDYKFRPINIFLNRKDKPYVQEGRYQNFEDAKKIDEKIAAKLNNKYILGENLFYIDYNNRESILKTVLTYIQ